MSTCRLKSYIFSLSLMLMPIAGFAADQSAAKPHGWNMEHCMPKMESHCRMNEAMEQMDKEMAAHRASQHCMPNMTAHCQVIADLEYMEQRMADMRINMQHCMETGEKDCPMPEMAGEMKAMRDRMDVLNKQMQEKDDKGQIDTQHDRVESHEAPVTQPAAKDSMTDAFHQHERERNIQ